MKEIVIVIGDRDAIYFVNFFLTKVFRIESNFDDGIKKNDGFKI